ALLDALYRRPEAETRGAASYLLGTNAHLARALRARGRRWLRRWGPNDGLVIAPAASPAVRAALAEHAFDRRAFSATALEKYAKCPYAFFLNTVHRLRAREVPEAIEEMDPLSRGSLTHEAQFATLVELRSRGWLPITQARLALALDVLDRELDAVAERFHDDLAPAIERVWQDGVSEIRADLREWLHRTAHETAWVPWRFELSFGLPAEQRESRDAHSQHDPVTLANGLRLRGSIDLVEETPAHDALRATDHKTGKAHVAPGAVVFGGTALQPLLYAMALESLFPDRRVDSGRLSYCTVRGDYEERTMPLDPGSRAALGEVLDTIRGAIEEGFLPAAPRPSECRWCDYARVCGPHEEQRVAKKPPEKLRRLVTLRGMP
ncbi:MAG: PD-(D/E)XK nuclease family protein, partial [Deltaproteobacteria bacterium]|nr:PD-(D/E)XK nuclease family protein [Deltaproteobacteria bacterium]